MNTLHYLMQKDQISDQVTELFLATDARDWPRVEACFARNVQFNTASVGGHNAEVTPADITRGWSEGLKSLQALHHQIGNLRIRLTGDSTATASCYGIAYHYLPTKSGQDTRTFVGTYDLKLQKQGDNWKITAFTFNLTFIDGNKQLEKDA